MIIYTQDPNGFWKLRVKNSEEWIRKMKSGKKRIVIIILIDLMRMNTWGYRCGVREKYTVLTFSHSDTHPSKTVIFSCTQVAYNLKYIRNKLRYNIHIYESGWMCLKSIISRRRRRKIPRLSATLRYRVLSEDSFERPSGWSETNSG